MEYVNIFQGDFIMGLAGLFGPILKQVLGGGASRQPEAIQREPQQQPPTTALEQVNAAVSETNPQELNQLHAAPDVNNKISKTEIPNEELLTEVKERMKKDRNFFAAVTANTIDNNLSNNGIDIKISQGAIQKVLTFVQPLLSDFKGNFDKFLTTPMDKSLPEYLKNIEPLLKTVIPPIENYMKKFDPTLKPENTLATANPA